MTDTIDDRIMRLETELAELRAVLGKDAARLDASDKSNLEQFDQHLSIIRSLNARMDTISAAVNAVELKRREEGQEMLHIIMRQSQSLDRKTDQIRLMTMRLDEVYYQVFPERLPQDAQVLDQIEAIAPRRDRGGGSPKDG